MAEKSQTKAAAAMADDKKRAIETAMQQIERTYGKGSIMRFGDNTVSNVEAISTGSLALDLALGIGGIVHDKFSVTAYIPQVQCGI